jgi:WASH complex subunit strumpellin
MSSLSFGLEGLALASESADGDFESSAAGEQLLWLVARGSAVIAELLRLSEHVPLAFLDNPISPHDKFAPLLMDFVYFKKPDALDSRAAQLFELDDECKDTHAELLQRFYQLFETIVRYAADLAYFSQQLNDGVFVQFTMENILMDNEGKQLMAEAFFLYGIMLLLMDMKIPGAAREKMIVAYYRYNGRAAIQTIEDVIKVCKNSGGNWLNMIKRPSKYPEEMFSRYPLPTQIIRMIIGKLRTDDIYNYFAAYPK